jgi:hypothetical protein
MDSFWRNFPCRVVLVKYDKDNNKTRAPQFPNFDWNNIFLSNTSYILFYISIFLYIYKRPATERKKNMSKLQYSIL